MTIESAISSSTKICLKTSETIESRHLHESAKRVSAASQQKGNNYSNDDPFMDKKWKIRIPK